MKKILIPLFFVSLFLSSAVFRAAAATPSAMGLKGYEEVSFSKIQRLEEYSGKKITFEMDLRELKSETDFKVPDRGYEVSTTYSQDWLKEAFPRDKFLVVDAMFPIVAFTGKPAALMLKTLKDGEKIKVFGTVKKKALRYQTKRTLFYLEVEAVEKSNPAGGL